VLLDGPGWAARRTVGDRDGLPVTVLGDLMRWPAVERVWMPEWLTEPEAVIDRLVDRTAHPPTHPDPAPEAEPSSAIEPQAAPVTAERPVTHPEPVSALSDETDFVAWQPARAGDREVLDRLADQHAVHQVWQVLVAGIEAEAPIHLDRLARLTAGAFGLTRLTAERRADLVACLPPGLPADPDGEPFAWPLGVDPLEWRGFRRSTDDLRPVDQISLIELGNAAAALCRVAAGMSVDQLRLSVLRTFGFARRTPERDARIDLALDVATRRGRLTQSPGGVWQAA
jgi:hypothetical protein